MYVDAKKQNRLSKCIRMWMHNESEAQKSTEENTTEENTQESSKEQKEK